jgi:hypothetical protein
LAELISVPHALGIAATLPLLAAGLALALPEHMPAEAEAVAPTGKMVMQSK